MRKHENDADLKIPSWYMKLPDWLLGLISTVGDAVNRVFHRKHGSKLEQCDTKFYL